MLCLKNNYSFKNSKKSFCKLAWTMKLKVKLTNVLLNISFVKYCASNNYILRLINQEKKSQYFKVIILK